MIRRELSSTAALLATCFALAMELRAVEDPRTRREGAQTSSARRIIVSLADRRLALVEGDKVIRIYRTAVGAPQSPSPVGSYQIINRISNPTYYVPGKVVPPGPANPLGTRWLGLNLQGYGIHGTNQPKSIGRAASHGCIRLRNQDMEELFHLVRAGDAVEIISRSSEELSHIFTQHDVPVPITPAHSFASFSAARN